MSNEVKWTTLSNNSSASGNFTYRYYDSAVRAQRRKSAVISDEEVFFEDETAPVEVEVNETPQEGTQIALAIGNCKCKSETLCDECVWNAYA